MRPMDTNGMKELCAAVVANACEEYLQSTPRALGHLIKWFHSDDFAFFSDLDPDTLISRLNEMRRSGMTRLLPLFADDSHHLHRLY